MGHHPADWPTDHPDHARAIAGTGGSVGIWHFFSSLDKYVDGLKEMVDIVGGRSCQHRHRPARDGRTVQDYTQWVHLVAAMLRRRFPRARRERLLGGNYSNLRAAVG